MVFMEPSRTPFDLSWRMLGTHVRVHPMFWVISALLGWPTMNKEGGGYQFLLLWIVCVFVSILIHEFGHVLMGRLFGAQGHIVLHGFGGLAIGSSALDRRWQRIFVYFAGPLAGFLFIGPVAAMVFGAPLMGTALELPPMLDVAFVFLLEINIGWGVLNLLPVWPLDGGQISRDFLEGLMPRQGNRVAMIVSMIVAVLCAIGSYYVLHQLYPVLLFAFLAYGSYQTMLQLEAAQSGWKEPDPWDRY
jgi:Zn-dependent protease